MSRIVRPRAFGGPEVLGVNTVELPTPGVGAVVVEVRAAGVNPLDWKLYSGAFHDVDDDEKDAAGLSEALPSLGVECAGVVTALGSNVEGVRVGDEVIVYPVTGAYADHVVVPSSSLTPKPASVSWEEAGGLMLAGLTAMHTVAAAGVGQGDTVLVHGGAGGVGLIAVQVALAAGAEVVATAAPRNHDLLRRSGAVPVTYGDGLAGRVRAAAPRRITAAIDTVGSDEALDVSLEFVDDRSRIASITGSDRRFGTGIKLIGYGPGQDAGTGYRLATRAALASLVETGTVRVLIARAFPLTEAAAAHRLGQEGGTTGKIVLVP
jgi:NADPH:quinone reductase-like Zn-dependent oxidoreductase